MGNANGFKYEAFNRHVQKPYHSRCQEQFENSIGQLKNGFVPEVTAWSLKISESLNEQLAAKVIAENWLSTEHVASDKYETLLDAFEKAKANVGTTHRNRRGFDIFNAVHSDFILKDQKHNFQNLRTFGLGADLGTDKSGRPQECISLRGVDTEKGELIDAALGYSLVRQLKERFRQLKAQPLHLANYHQLRGTWYHNLEPQKLKKVKWICQLVNPQT